jgi:hypothetical protein
MGGIRCPIGELHEVGVLGSPFVRILDDPSCRNLPHLPAEEAGDGVEPAHVAEPLPDEVAVTLVDWNRWPASPGTSGPHPAEYAEEEGVRGSFGNRQNLGGVSRLPNPGPYVRPFQYPGRRRWCINARTRMSSPSGR